ncbi:MAG: RnfABCDGE type electron transport complex subunit G [Lachnospirales bacterium]
MEKYGKPIITLFIITAVAGFILALAYNLTKDAAEEQKNLATSKAMQSVLIGAVDFKSVETGDENIPIITTAFDDSGNVIGYIAETLVSGYSGTIDILVGFDLDFIVTGIDILSHSETPGLGANSTEPEFETQYAGSKGLFSVVKTGSQTAEEIDAITGATITSNAVTQGVNNAIEFVLEYEF